MRERRGLAVGPCAWLSNRILWSENVKPSCSTDGRIAGTFRSYVLWTRMWPLRGHHEEDRQGNACYRAAVDSGRDATSFFMTTPPFITNLTRSISVTSVSGLPATAMTSPNLPFSRLPTRFAQL